MKKIKNLSLMYFITLSMLSHSTIGNIGPNISSFIIYEFSLGFNMRVGSIYLYLTSNFPFKLIYLITSINNLSTMIFGNHIF